MSKPRISDEAVEVLARRDYDATAAQSDYEFPLWEDAAKDPEWSTTVQDFRDDARKTLEQIAPHLMAELAEPGSAMREAMSIAWEQGREDGYHHRPNPYRSEED